MSGRVAIVGASVRAAAFSALRAGLVPIGIDLFADWDLRRRAEAVRVSLYPDGLETALAQRDIDGWFYTGGLENHPDSVDRIAAKRTLWGNPGAVLRAARDPFLCAQALRDARVLCPAVTASPQELPLDGSWLQKPLYGSGGAGIRPWEGQSPGSGAARCFFQKLVTGVPCSAVFVGATGRSVLLGVTWQLVGAAWTHAPPFSYAGSIGPLDPQPEFDSQWERIGRIIARRFGLAGLFGVDAMFDGQSVWPVEINPRYPASVEVLERALGINAVALHVDACRLGKLPKPSPPARRRWCGKAVHYAWADLVVPSQFAPFAEEEMKAWPWPNLADVPAAGTRIRSGRPITTVLAEARDELSLRSLLQQRVDRAERTLRG